MNVKLLEVSKDNSRFKSIVSRLDNMSTGSSVGTFKKSITGWQDSYGNWCSTTTIAEQVFYNLLSI